MESDRVLRPAAVDAERVVRAVLVQRQQVQHHHRDDHERQQVMQRIKAIEGRVANREPAPEQGHDVVADHRDRREQIGDDGRGPVAHLAPGQHVAHERGRHHQ